jgi:hypothetical protein
MIRATRLLILTLACANGPLVADPILPESTREIVTRVCGFCHFPDFFDESSGELIEVKFLEKSEKILDRLQRPKGTAGRMPPARSPVTIADDERLELVDFLKSWQPLPPVMETCPDPKTEGACSHEP